MKGIKESMMSTMVMALITKVLNEFDDDRTIGSITHKELKSISNKVAKEMSIFGLK